MSDALEKLQHELKVSQRALAAAEVRIVHLEDKHQDALEEVDKVRLHIEQAHREWMNALDVVEDPIFVHDKDFRILRCNQAYQRNAGIPFKQIIGQPYYEIFPKTHAPLPSCQHALEDTRDEIMVGDTTYRSRAYSVSDGQGSYLYSVHLLEDINERLQTNRTLRESELQYRRLFESAKDGILLLDAETGKVVDANPFILDLLSYKHEKLSGKMLWEIGLFKDIESSKDAFLELQAKGYIRYEDLPLETKDGRRREVEFVSNVYEVGDHKVIQCNIRDITESMRAKELLLASRNLLQNVVENAPVRVFWKDTELRYLGCNSAFAHDAGMQRPEDVIGKDDFQMSWHEQAELYRADDMQVMSSTLPLIGREEPQTTPDGRTIWLRTSKVPLRAVDGNIFGILGIYEDITERKQGEESLRRANRALQTLSAGNHALVQAKDENGLLQSVTRVIAEQAGYSMAVVDYAENDPEKSITPKVWAGYAGSHYWAEHLTWADTEAGQLPISRTIRSGQTQLCQDIASDPAFEPWKDAALALGYASNIALPMSDGNRTFGCLSIYASDANAFDAEEIPLLEELAVDLAYGIVNLRARIEQTQHAIILRQSLEQSIETIADTVEARDPYTAGHQRRVSELAVTIAQEMGLPKDQIKGIHLAGIVHDLGKIRVPAEILSKPGRLNEIEYMLVQRHAQDGHDILKGVKFPWPIADIVFQHHERLDGSGYPQGLSGDAILLEAKIMAVADVVEAMSSHRPYRPGLGIDAALGEISRMRGTHYDPKVVDVCVALFREKEYVIQDRSLATAFKLD